MANSDKDILITPGKDTANLPEISFVGLDNAPIQLKVLDDNTISFEGSSGQLFSINNNLTIGTIFSVNDVSGIPAIETTAEGLNYLSPYYGNTIIGPGSKQLTGIDSTRPAFILNSNGNNTRYDMEVFANHGISDGNYGGITFTQGSSGAYSTQLASIRIEYTNAGHPHIGFYTRSGVGEVRRMHIQGGNSRDGNVGINVSPGGGYLETPGKLTINSGGTHSAYNAICLTHNTSNNGNKGSTITGAPYSSSNPPWTAFGVWSTNSENNIYIGGGGWGNQAEATQIWFFTGSGQGNNARGTRRWNMTSAGNFEPHADASYNIGSTSNRVNNIYTTDLHLSNRGSKNVVDGTWGDWTLQEGEEEIYMLNNRNGKRFKMVLQEVQ